MRNLIDLTGQRFGRLVVLSRAQNKGAATAWNCLCECGNHTIVRSDHLRSEHTESCGCYLDEVRVTHGHTRGGKWSREYQAWLNARTRCYNPKFIQFGDWGGRGIKMCEKWKDDFSAFYRDMGPCPEGRGLNRIDNDGDYRPGNCEWASNKDQNRNRRNSRYLECSGERKILTDWAAELGISPSNLSQKLKKGIRLESLVERSRQTMPMAA